MDKGRREKLEHPETWGLGVPRKIKLPVRLVAERGKYDHHGVTRKKYQEDCAFMGLRNYLAYRSGGGCLVRD